MKITSSLYEKISKLTGTDYEPFMRGDAGLIMLDEDRVQSMLEDLLMEISHREEKIEDLKEDIKENYTPNDIDPYEEYGVSKNDF